MSDPPLGRFVVLRANGAAETVGPSSQYYDSLEAASEQAKAQCAKSHGQQYAVAQIVSVVSQELQMVEKRL